MRKESGYYPPGAEFDPYAPYNQPDDDYDDDCPSDDYDDHEPDDDYDERKLRELFNEQQSR